MKKPWLFLAALLAISEKSPAAMEGLGVSARSVGMADAFSAVADDSSAILHNPAGLTQLRETALSVQSANFLGGLTNKSNVDTNSLALVHPVNEGQRGVVGFFYQNFKASSYFTDQTFYLSYAKNLSSQAFGMPGRWSVGGNIKRFTRKYEPDQYTENAIDDSGMGTGVPDPLFATNGFSKTVYSADAGLLYQFGEKNRNNLGLSISNLNRPDISLGKDGDRVPLMNRAGLARKYDWGLLSMEIRKVNRLSNESDSEIALGGERRIALPHIGSLGLRGGYSEGTRGFRNVSAGISFGGPIFTLDYAFQFPLGDFSGNGENNVVALSFNFGTGKSGNASASHSSSGKLAGGAREIFPIPPTDNSNQANPLYGDSLNHYLARKADGASIQERLKLLEDLYLKSGSEKTHMIWLAQELGALGRP